MKKLSKERLKQLEEENNAEHGLGLKRIWELRQDHPFMPCGKEHDLSYLTAYELERMGEDVIAKEVVKKADREFKECCFKIAKDKDSFWLKLQAYTFSKIVDIYSCIRF